MKYLVNHFVDHILKWCLFFFWPRSLWDLSSLTRDWTRALISENVESQPLDCQGIPKMMLFWIILGYGLPWRSSGWLQAPDAGGTGSVPGRATKILHAPQCGPPKNPHGLYWIKQNIFLKLISPGTSLVVQWLRLHLPVQGVWVWSLIRELSSHLPRGQKTKTWNRGYIVTNSIKTLKMVHIKKKSLKKLISPAYF